MLFGIDVWRIPSFQSLTSATSSEKDAANADTIFADVLVDKNPVSEELHVLQIDDHLYLPVRALSLLLGFRLEIEPTTGKMSGFLRSPSDRLFVDFKQNWYSNFEGHSTFPRAEAVVQDKELFVKSSLFEKLTDTTIEWDTEKLQLRVLSTKPLPCQAQRILHQVDPVPYSQVKLDRIQQSNTLFSLPAWDVSLASSVGQGATASESEVSAVGYGDLLFLNAQYQYLSSSILRPQLLGTLSHQDANQSMLGPLHASKIQAGYMVLDPEPLITGYRTATGISITNKALTENGAENEISVEFHAAIGATVELYSKDKLIASKIASQDYKDNFFRVYLEPGKNQFFEVVIDKSGEIRTTKITRYRLAGAPLNSTVTYDFTADQPKSAVDYSNPTVLHGSTEVINRLSSKKADNVWLSQTTAAIQRGNSTELIGGLGLKSFLENSLLAFDITESSQFGLAASSSIGTTGRAQSVSFGVTHSFRSAYVLDHPSNNALFASVRGMSTGPRLSQSFNLTMYAAGSNDPYPFISGNLDVETKRLGSSTYFQMTRQDFLHQVSGITDLRYKSGKNSERLSLSFDTLRPGIFTQASLGISTPVNPMYFAHMGMTINQAGIDPYGLNLGFFRRLGAMAAGLNLNIGSTSGAKIGFVFSTALDLEERGTGLMAPGLASLARARVRVFLDDSGSTQFRNGDKLLSGIAIKVNGHALFRKTSSNGVFEIDNLPADSDTQISLDEESFPDPNWISSSPGYVIRTTAGKTINIDLGVCSTSELGGIVDTTNKLGFDILRVCLRNLSTNKELLSPVDGSGSYGFSRVKAGTYRLVLMDNQKNELFARNVDVKPGLFLSDLDLKQK